jgi:formylglycine-generating enzyme required for sulfatase activity/Tfp pilus assembly protein PilF
MFAALVSEADAASQGPLEEMQFISIPAGEFPIGSDIPGDDYFDEIPKTVVQIESFEMMSTEVTQGMWEELMDSDSSSIRLLWTDLCGRGSDYPAYAVSWFDCKEFINRLNRQDSSFIYRLPGEAEWEYACRAESDTDFFWGDPDQASRYCRCRVNKLDQTNAPSHTYGTRETASFEANSWGLFDMAGNVSEWCQDRYSPDYDYLPSDGTPFLYPCDDQWPYQMNTRRVHRGGSWLTVLKECRSGNRSSQPPELWATSIGFRLVRVPRNNRNYALMLFQEGVDSIDAYSNRDGLELFTRALELDPTMIDALLYRGFFRQGIGETEQSLADFNKAIELDPANAGTYNMMGIVLSDAEYYLQALKVFNRVAELDPDYPGIYYQRGFAQLFLWNLDEAISDLTRAIEYVPGSPSAYYARGTAYFVNEQFHRALGDMAATIERNPGDGDAYMMRSQIYLQMGNLEQARSDSISAAALGVR